MKKSNGSFQAGIDAAMAELDAGVAATHDKMPLHKRLLARPLGLLRQGVFLRAPIAPEASGAHAIAPAGYVAGRPWARKGLSRAQRRARTDFEALRNGH